MIAVKSLLPSDESLLLPKRRANKDIKFRVDNGGRLHTHRHTLIGFVFGFLMALATLLFYDHYMLLSEQLERHTTGTEYYRTGYMAALQKLASTEQLETSSLQQQLENEIKVLCMVLTCPQYHQSRAAHVLATWGKRCSKLIFISSEDDAELGAVEVVDNSTDTHDHLWNKTREGFRYVYEKYFEEYDWFLKADDDTYVIMENLRYMLYSYSPEIPINFGYKLITLELPYMSGGAAYVLSKEALRSFMTDAFDNQTLCASADQNGPEDFFMGVCLRNIGVYLVDSKFAAIVDEKPKFFPLDLMAYMDPNWNFTIVDWIIEMTPYPLEMSLKCCSNYSIAFHYVDPQHMYTYEFLIYHLLKFGMNPPIFKLPAKISQEEVTRLFSNNNNSISTF